jgi:hypothetical protein
MSLPVEKQCRATKRGCLWLLLGLPSLLLVYLFLLSTSIFDIKPSRFPDLEIQARGKTKPFLEALAAAPEWAAWKASEIARNDALNELRQDSPTRPKSESAAALRPELARAISLATWLSDQEVPLGLPPMPEGRSPYEFSYDGFDELRDIFQTLRAAPLIALHTGEKSELIPVVSPAALRLLAKSNGLEHSMIGRLIWLTTESAAHEVLAADLFQWIQRNDTGQLRQALRLLEACRPSGEFPPANVWKAEFAFGNRSFPYLKSQVGKLGSGVLMGMGTGGTPSLGQALIEQWMLLRIQPNRCVARMAGDTRDRIRLSALPARDRIWPIQDPGAWKKLISPAPNAAGEVVLQMGTSAYQRFLENEDRGLARHHLLRLLIGLALYRIEHANTLPADLQALVPRYLPAIPGDPYTGEPPLYLCNWGDQLAFRGGDFVASPIPIDAVHEKSWREKGLPPGFAALFHHNGSHDPGVYLKVIFRGAGTN